MSDSPAKNDVQPLHNPDQAAVVSLPQAPLGNATNGPTSQPPPGLGAKALLAKKMAKNQNPSFVSPTDNMVTPVSQKLNAVKKKNFNKAAPKPMGNLFAQQSSTADSDEEETPAPAPSTSTQDDKMAVDDEENPF